MLGPQAAQVAPAWVPASPAVSAPIVGPTKPHHLADAAAGLDLTLTGDDVRTLEEPCTAREPTGF
jgi:aryl-alcohol dehydrogenase-like predicted oxidoreductase